jgi:hypothetical protein
MDPTRWNWEDLIQVDDEFDHVDWDTFGVRKVEE